MPWQNNGDGERPNPWGNGPRRGGSGGGGEPPNIDDYIRKGQERLRQSMPGGKGGYFVALLVVVFVWLCSGFYHVETNEQAVVLRFGKWVNSSSAGLHWHLPYPLEQAEVRGVTDARQMVVGGNDPQGRGASRSSRGLDESQMLTKDENIVEITFTVVWRIGDLGKYLFVLEDPEGTIRAVSQSVMREMVGNSEITPIITNAKGQLQDQVKSNLQATLDSYNSGIDILEVQIARAEAPVEVKESFLDVQRAEADQQRFRNEADAYKNKVVREAEGQAERMVQVAESYRAQTVARAQGEAARFLSVYEEYVQAKDVTKKRMYLETMEQILAGMDKVVVDGQGSGVVPYLPLDQLTAKQKSGEK